MTLEKHSLTEEFPDMRDRIHALKATDAHFVRLFKEYDAVEHDVHRIECGAEAASDARLESLKKERLKLKDVLFSMLNAA